MWNMSAEEVEWRFKVKRCECYDSLAEELMAYVDSTGGEVKMVLFGLAYLQYNPIPVFCKDMMDVQSAN